MFSKIVSWIKTVFTKGNVKRFIHGAEGRIRTDASLRILITNQAQSTTVPPRRQNV